jgi:hypothetical protein
MNSVTQTLANVVTDYSVFEKDQVLTHDQLNSIARYVEPQTRLTRVNLIGVGIVSGLRVSLDAGKGMLTKGLGITTDGDLLFIGADTTFDKFKVYGATYPAYAPFCDAAGKLNIQAFELLPQSATEALAKPLSQFNAQPGLALETMSALLLMESYVKDQDVCSGTDCDNLGKSCLNNARLLLVTQSVAAQLLKRVAAPGPLGTGFKEITVPRPAIPQGTNSPAPLAGLYRAACGTIHDQLAGELPKLYPACAALLKETFASDPSAGWLVKLSNLKNTTFSTALNGIQYYYDFLKDLAETWNALRGLLFTDHTWGCPDISAFPKHLLLGNLARGADPNDNRFSFYSSPLAGRTADQFAHAQFLARKADTLIQAFQAPPPAGAIRITPSLFEDRDLEERAIPYYYVSPGAYVVHQSWSYCRHQRGADAFNYGYNAASYGAQGGAANPLGSGLGRFSFFRIEGHLGQNAATALSTLENLLQANNLPFAVRSLHLGTDPALIIKRPGIRYSDLHRFHFMLRQDVANHLDEVTTFSGSFKDQVSAADSVGAESDATTLKNTASAQHQAINSGVTNLKTKLARTYTDFQADASWKGDMGATVQAASQFKAQLGNVVRTEFPTPFDSLINAAHLRWIDWLDQIIKGREAQEDATLLFANFIAQHPQLEHFGGVTRGGTFLLVHDANKVVVADFMLPYFLPDPVRPQPEEKPLLPIQPPIRLPGVITGGIKILPSRDKFVTAAFQDKIAPSLNEKINLQKDYLRVFSDAINLVKQPGKVVQVPGMTDRLLELKLQAADLKQQEADLLDQKANDPSTPQPLKRQFSDQAKAARTELTQAIQDATRYVATSKMDLSPGSDGQTALSRLSDKTNRLPAENKAVVKADVERLKADNPALRNAAAGMFNG